MGERSTARIAAQPSARGQGRCQALKAGAPILHSPTISICRNAGSFWPARSPLGAAFICGCNRRCLMAAHRLLSGLERNRRPSKRRSSARSSPAQHSPRSRRLAIRRRGHRRMAAAITNSSAMISSATTITIATTITNAMTMMIAMTMMGAMAAMTTTTSATIGAPATALITGEATTTATIAAAAMARSVCWSALRSTRCSAATFRAGAPAATKPAAIDLLKRSC